MGILERIADIEKEMQRTQKNKGELKMSILYMQLCSILLLVISGNSASSQARPMDLLFLDVVLGQAADTVQRAAP